MAYTEYDYQQLLLCFKELSDDKYREFSEKLIPDTKNIIGVRIPDLRKLAKQITKEDYKGFLAVAKDTTHEEIMLQGMVTALAKEELNEKLQQITRFVPKIKNWAVCDIFCGSFRFNTDEKKIVWDFLLQYTKSQNEYDLRFAVVMMMSYFLEQDYIDELLKILPQIHHDGYYIKMAVAWALSVCFVKFREKTLELLCTNSLDDFTQNKTIQKIVESFRVDEADKRMLREWKRPKKQKEQLQTHSNES